MQQFKYNLLARTSVAALAAAALAAATPAQAQTQAYGAGATLPSLVLSELFDCYGLPPGVPPDCPSQINPNAQFSYNSVGSGRGIVSWLSHSPNIAVQGTSLTAFPNHNFSVSEAAITTSQLSAYNNGGSVTQSGITVTLVAPGVVPGPGQFANPRELYGPAIQIPIAGAAVAIAYDRVYRRLRTTQNGPIVDYSYNNQFPRSNDSGGIRLDRAAYCRIFAGVIRRWDDPALTALNNGVPLYPGKDEDGNADPGPLVTPRIELAVRGDSSGTTALFTRHIAEVCEAEGFFNNLFPPGFSTNFPGIPTSFSPSLAPEECRSVTSSIYPDSRIVAAQGNENVSFCTDTRKPKKAAGSERTNFRISYLSNDFVRPYVDQAPFSSYRINSFTLRNSSGNFVAPTPGAITAALGAQTPPAVGPDRANPINWVAAPGAVAGAGVNPVADPSAANAYSIVGTPNLLLYTCYNGQALTDIFARTSPSPIGFLNWLYTSSAAGNILADSGFAALPSALSTEIRNTFATPGDAQDLFIRPGPVVGLCTSGG
jgi:ABC-type phosphate transport system substrate-binding protein